MGHETTYKQCAEPGCEAAHAEHYHGKVQAQLDGWFMQRNGDAWCPEHNPPWVEEWRARQKTFPKKS